MDAFSVWKDGKYTRQEKNSNEESTINHRPRRKEPPSIDRRLGPMSLIYHLRHIGQTSKGLLSAVPTSIDVLLIWTGLLAFLLSLPVAEFTKGMLNVF